MVVALIPDAEPVMVDWAKADADLNALLAGRVSTRLPGKDLQFPFLRVRQITGSQLGSAPIASARLQLDAYGAKGSGAPNLAQASAVIRTAIAVAEAWDGGAISGAWIYGFRLLTGPVEVPEPQTQWARFRADLLMTYRKA